MKGLAPEIDRLMWSIAERRDDAGAAEFQQKFPELAGELNKRLTMVRGLKGAKALMGGASSIPQFQPVNMPTPIFARPRFALAGAVGLAVLGVASYWVTTNVIGEPVKPAPLVRPLHEGAPQSAPKPNRSRTFTGIGVDGDVPVQPTVPKVQSQIEGSQRPSKVPTTENSYPPVSVDEPRHNLTLKEVPLHQALQMIGTSCGLKIVIAPKTPNPMVEGAYQGKVGWEILEDLGKKYGFKAFSQGDHEALVVPTIEAWEPNTDVTGETASADR